MVKQDEKCYWEILEKNIFWVLEKEGFQPGLGNHRREFAFEGFSFWSSKFKIHKTLKDLSKMSLITRIESRERKDL